MSLVDEPPGIGFVPRFVRVYRELRRPVRSVRYEFDSSTPHVPHRVEWHAPWLPRRAALRIAWRQARNGRGL